MRCNRCLDDGVVHHVDGEEICDCGAGKAHAAGLEKMKAKNDWESPRDPWYGVDLDGTLAHYGDKALPWNVVGPPIPRMVQRVKEWIALDKTVRIVTARVFPYIHDIPGALVTWPSGQEVEEMSQRCLVTGERFTIRQMLQVIRDYTEEHVGKALEATCAKDYRMLQLWDDRAIQVIANTGMTLSGEDAAIATATEGKAQG